jgi:cytochrome c oxidase assembly factor CtaG
MRSGGNRISGLAPPNVQGGNCFFGESFCNPQRDLGDRNCDVAEHVGGTRWERRSSLRWMPPHTASRQVTVARCQRATNRSKVNSAATFPSIMLVARSPGTGLGTLLSSWRTDSGGLVLTAIGAATIGAYSLVSFANRKSNEVTFIPGSAAFVAGVTVCLWAFCSGLASPKNTAPGIVVADHLALVTLAPVLLAFGSPFRRVAAALHGSVTRARQGATASIIKVALHPAVVFAALFTLEYAYLLSPLYGWSLDHQQGGDLIRGAFLLVGCAYWWPIVGTDRWPLTMSGGVRMLDLAATLPFTAFLGIDLTLTQRRLPRSGSLEATHVAGAELWGYPTLFTVAALGAVFFWWMRQEDERAAALDRGLDTIDAAEAIVQQEELRFRNGTGEDE